MVHKEIVPEGKTVNTGIYKGVMDSLLKRIQRVRPSSCIVLSRDFFFICTIMRLPSKAAIVCQILAQENVTTPLSTPQSPDLSPPGYFISPKLKMKLKGLHFADVAHIQEAVTDDLNFRRLMSTIVDVPHR